MSSDRQPLVSLAIPLYRSKPFQPIIVENLERLNYSNLEILISDRHGEDNTLDALAERYAGDPRFLFFKASDRLNWREHYNRLLQRARGDYLLWMPHDDSYPSNYIPDLVDALEANPDAVIACGHMKMINLQGEPLTDPVLPFERVAAGEWSPRMPLRLLMFWDLGRPFRGLVRLAPIRRAGLIIRPTYENSWADICWVFGAALLGRLHFASNCYCIKRYHPASADVQVHATRRHRMDHLRVLRSYVDDLVLQRGDAAYLTAGLVLWTGLRLVGTSELARRSGRRESLRQLYLRLRSLT